MKRLSIIDSHTGGEPTRVVLDGVPESDLELYRRALLSEPRGNDVIVGALLLPPTRADCEARVIFFNNAGRLGMCGHGMIGVITTLQHLGRLKPGVQRVETPVGVVTTTLHEDGQVSVRNVPAFVKSRRVHAGEVTGEVAYGGNWFFLCSDHGLLLTRAHVPELLRRCQQIREAVHAAGHPEVDHIELLGPPEDVSNHARNFVFCPGNEYDRSPCGTGTSAKLACLAAAGKLAPGEIWRQESVLGTVFSASYEMTPEGLVPTITGKAYLTAEATLLLDEQDPFRFGIP